MDENVLKVTDELQGGFWREYFQIRMDKRRRASEVKPIPQKGKLAAYCDTQEKAGREKERRSCWDF